MVHAFEVKARPKFAKLGGKRAAIVRRDTIAIEVAGLKAHTFSFDALLVGQATDAISVALRRRIGQWIGATLTAAQRQ